MVLKVLVHGSVLDGNVQREEVLDNFGTLGAEVRGSAVPQEELDHVYVERLGSDVERRESIQVADVEVDLVAAQLGGRALQHRPGATQGVVGDE